MGKPFKTCPHCHSRWMCRDDMLSDPSIELIGYQANTGDLRAGYFLFNHDTDECETSLAVKAKEFIDLYTGPVFENAPEQVPNCPGYCQDHRTLDKCDAQCECAFVREILHQVLHWRKTRVKEG